MLWVGAQNGIENILVPKEDISIVNINISGLRQKGSKRLVIMPFILLYSLFQSIKLILIRRPDMVVGFGGYVSFPICLAARILDVPVIIHEQNSIAGLSNKLLAKIATNVLVAYPRVLSSKKTYIVGNPVREDICSILPPTLRYANRNGGLNILIIGGSLGAKVFNDLLPLVIAQVAKIKPNHINRIVHQVGKGNTINMLKKYEELAVYNVTVVEFIEDMARQYSETDLLIARSGASTVAEVCACGIAAIFIPFPHAVDDHQRHNVTALVEASAALMVLQHNLHTNLFAEIIVNLDRGSCQIMAEKAKALFIPNSVDKIKQIIVTCLNTI